MTDDEKDYIVRVDVRRFMVLFETMEGFMADMKNRPDYYAEDPRALLMTYAMLKEATRLIGELYEMYHTEEDDDHLSESKRLIDDEPTKH